ncbi:hypothetical protein QBC37DRAFT_435098 [Rhypophila decipiens]|uniref:Uncharacterized protein n=1 Tax=Rhypophila decipiens TaxID=261697 RepID=A0AAN6XXH8_9PEZI|nr:hypothetical protein QBC37DRAFT_435098 [Rhypophila decipiens]
MALLTTSLLLSLALADHHQGLLPRNISFPINITSDVKFDDFIASANASTVRDIVAPNIHTNEYPSTGQDVEWKAWLEIDELSARGGAMRAGFHPGEEYISDNGTVQSDDSWLACMRLTRFRNPGLPVDEVIQTNCSNVFPDECLQFLNQISQDGRLCHNSTEIEDRPLWENSPCSGALNGEYFTRLVLEPSKFVHVDQVYDLLTATGTLQEDGGPDQRYDALVNSVYMLAVGFARAIEKANRTSDPRIDPDAETVPSQFICMRADHFSNGSRTLNDIANVGIGMSAPVGWTMVLAACIVAMMTAGIL